MESEIDSTPGLPEHEKTFMGLLREHGYVTGATGKIHMMPERDFNWQEIVGGKWERRPLDPGDGAVVPGRRALVRVCFPTLAAAISTL
eukprot:scaffold2043_cov31-Attheya_sp.AAC.1